MKPNTNNIVAATAAAAALAGGEAQANHTPTTPLTPATQEAVQLLADQASQTPLTPDSIITLPAPATPAAPEFIPEKKGGAEQIVPGGPGDSSDKPGIGPVDQDVNEAGFTKRELAMDEPPVNETSFTPGENPDNMAEMPSPTHGLVANQPPIGEQAPGEDMPDKLASPQTLVAATGIIAQNIGEIVAKHTPQEEVEADADRENPVETPVATQVPELPDKPKTEPLTKDPDQKSDAENPELVPGIDSETHVPPTPEPGLGGSPEGPAGYPVNLVMGDAVQQMGDAVAQDAEAANTTPQETKAIRNPGE